MNKYLVETLNKNSYYVDNIIGDGIQFRNSITSTIKTIIESYNFAWKCHSNIENYIRNLIDINKNVSYGETIMSYEYLFNMINNYYKSYFCDEFNYGISFPLTVGKNNVVGHATYGINDTNKITNDGIYKIDFGTLCNGFVADGAFSISFDYDLDPLIDSTNDALNHAVKMAGIDVRLIEISNEINEIVTSYEATIGGITKQLNPIRTVGGHTLIRYDIHGDGETVIWDGINPYLSFEDQEKYTHTKMKDNTCYAIEPFVTTGDGNYDLYSIQIDPTPE
jgi:methionine aminopeptidase